ncbi:hypothetical protein [Helicobacter pylori]|uniref:hypothetical protein n=1 Tax=Helicobacter pylori TaxID=210 RepID=UPI0002BB93DE|nr:hypothetical protein [Helicobacter pylori]
MAEENFFTELKEQTPTNALTSTGQNSTTQSTPPTPIQVEEKNEFFEEELDGDLTFKVSGLDLNFFQEAIEVYSSNIDYHEKQIKQLKLKIETLAKITDYPYSIVLGLTNKDKKRKSTSSNGRYVHTIALKKFYLTSFRSSVEALLMV